MKSDLDLARELRAEGRAAEASVLLRRRSLRRNAVTNLIGQAVPLLVALLALPVLARSLGADRFGVLSLAWAILGYFSMFDLGLGRAVTKLVAEKIGQEQH